MKKIHKTNKKVIPINQTILTTANEEQFINKIPKVSDENVIISKKCVDENHK